MVMKKVLMFVSLVIVLLVAGGAVVMCAQPRQTVIKSGAGAWIWVKPDAQTKFIDEMRAYAQRKSLKFSYYTLPGPPWKSLNVLLETPAGNKIDIGNVGAEKMSVAMFVLNKDEHWQSYWNDFRAYVSAEYKWQNTP